MMTDTKITLSRTGKGWTWEMDFSGETVTGRHAFTSAAIALQDAEHTMGVMWWAKKRKEPTAKEGRTRADAVHAQGIG